MKVVLSDRAIEALKDAPAAVERAFYKQLRFLEDNLLHPSLHAKKYDETADLWQARVNRDWRFISPLPATPTASKTSFHIQNRRRENVTWRPLPVPPGISQPCAPAGWTPWKPCGMSDIQ